MPDEMTMPFGRYRGKPLREIPADYLRWVLTIDPKPRLREAIELELKAREEAGEDDFEFDFAEFLEAGGRQRGCEPPPMELDFKHPVQKELLRELVAAGHKALLLKYHPDKGGDTTRCQYLNALVGEIRRRLA